MTFVNLTSAAQAAAGGTDELSLRRDFAINPSQSASSLTTAINSAIVSAISAGRPLSIGYDMWPIDGPLTIAGALRLTGAGTFPLYGSQNVDFKSIDLPVQTPFLQGAGFIQTTAGQDVLRLTGAGLPVQLENFGIRFDGGRFANTGHAVVGTPPAYTGTQDNGALGSRWRNLNVFGHDGNHYAYLIQNVLYGTFDNLHSWGGGCLRMQTNATTGANQRLYGGSVFTHLYGQIICAGSAHGLWMNSVSSIVNGCHFMRPQITVQDVGATARAILSSGSAPTSAQDIVRLDANTRFFTFDQPDWETNVGSVVNLGSVPSVYLDPAGIVFPIGTNFDSFRARQQDTASRYAFPGPVGLKAYATASRPTGQPAGAGVYDSTLGKPVWSDGAGAWKDAAGATV